MATYTTVTPVLSSKAGYIADIRDQVASFVRFVIMNPGWTSSIWEDRLVSFRVLASKYEQDRNMLVNTLQSQMNTVLSKMFRDYTFNLDFSTDNYKPNENGESSQYSIKFSIMFNKNNEDIEQSALLSGQITVNKDTNDIDINYDYSIDSNFSI